jgi:hypothetical protein
VVCRSSLCSTSWLLLSFSSALLDGSCTHRLKDQAAGQSPFAVWLRGMADLECGVEASRRVHFSHRCKHQTMMYCRVQALELREPGWLREPGLLNDDDDDDDDS